MDHLNGGVELVEKAREFGASHFWGRQTDGATTRNFSKQNSDHEEMRPPAASLEIEPSALARQVCSDAVMVHREKSTAGLSFSRSNVIKCLGRTNCAQAAASVCDQANGATDLVQCSLGTLRALPIIDRRELAIQFEQRQCFREALIWILGAQEGDFKPSLARWKRAVCAAGRGDLLDDSTTLQALVRFGVNDPSTDPEVEWKTCRTW